MSAKSRFMRTRPLDNFPMQGTQKAIDRSEAYSFISECCFQECAHRCKVHGGTMEQHTHILVIQWSCQKVYFVIPNMSTRRHNSIIFGKNKK